MDNGGKGVAGVELVEKIKMLMNYHCHTNIPIIQSAVLRCDLFISCCFLIVMKLQW